MKKIIRQIVFSMVLLGTIGNAMAGTITQREQKEQKKEIEQAGYNMGKNIAVGIGLGLLCYLYYSWSGDTWGVRKSYSNYMRVPSPISIPVNAVRGDVEAVPVPVPVDAREERATEEVKPEKGMAARMREFTDEEILAVSPLSMSSSVAELEIDGDDERLVESMKKRGLLLSKSKNENERRVGKAVLDMRPDTCILIRIEEERRDSEEEARVRQESIDTLRKVNEKAAYNLENIINGNRRRRQESRKKEIKNVFNHTDKVFLALENKLLKRETARGNEREGDTLVVDNTMKDVLKKMKPRKNSLRPGKKTKYNSIMSKARESVKEDSNRKSSNVIEIENFLEKERRESEEMNQENMFYLDELDKRGRNTEKVRNRIKCNRRDREDERQGAERCLFGIMGLNMDKFYPIRKRDIKNRNAYSARLREKYEKMKREESRKKLKNTGWF